VGQGAASIRYGVLIEKDGARDMGLFKVGARVAAVQVPAAIDDPQVRRAQSTGEVCR
jgi:hypothetical protein